MSHQWFYQHEGIISNETKGPYDEQTFIEMVEAGDVKEGATINSPTRTGGQWIELRTHPKLMEYFNRGAMRRKREKEERKKARQQEREEQQAARDRQREEKRIADEELRQAEARERAAHAAQLEAEANERRAIATQEEAAATPFAPGAQTTAAPQPPQVYIVNQLQQDNNKPLALILNMVCCMPGTGQLVQGKFIRGGIILGLWGLSLLLAFVWIGFVTAPCVWLYAVADVFLD